MEVRSIGLLWVVVFDISLHNISYGILKSVSAMRVYNYLSVCGNAQTTDIGLRATPPDDGVGCIITTQSAP